MDYISIIISIIKILVFVLVAGAAIFVAYMSHKNQIKEHFSQDISGINIAFNAVLNRDPNKNEFDYFSEMASNGFTRTEFETILKNIKANISSAYNETLKRDPTETEINEAIPTFTTYPYKYDDIVSFIQTRSTTPSTTVDSASFTVPSSGMESVTLEQRIADNFIAVMSRDPTPEEIIKYATMVNNNELSLLTLKDYLMASTEYMEMQKKAKDTQLTADIKQVDAEYPPDSVQTKEKDYDVYINIISLYQGVLQRNPTSAELDTYYTHIDNKTKTLKDIRIILQESAEYASLLQSHTSTMDAEVISDMTDRQMNHMISTQFQKVYNRAPTEGETRFLQDKMMSYSMDNEALYGYIYRLKDMERGEKVVDYTSGDDVPGFGMTPTDYMIDQPKYRGPGSKYKMGSIFDIAERVSKLLSDNSKPQGYTTYVNQRNTADIDNMSAKYQTGFEKEDELVNAKPQKIVDNHTPVKNNCLPCRVSPLLDQTSLLGTLLHDANDTQVGSILPKFEYREL